MTSRDVTWGHVVSRSLQCACSLASNTVSAVAFPVYKGRPRRSQQQVSCTTIHISTFCFSCRSDHDDDDMHPGHYAERSDFNRR